MKAGDALEGALCMPVTPPLALCSPLFVCFFRAAKCTLGISMALVCWAA